MQNVHLARRIKRKPYDGNYKINNIQLSWSHSSNFGSKISVGTLSFVVEEVVVLRDICDDAQPVGHLHGHHVLWVQQGWNPQLCLRHLKCLK